MRSALHSTAIHEAGHAVVSYHFGRGVRRITIKPKGDTLGHVAYTRMKPHWQPNLVEGLQHMQSALAGYLAERAFGYRPRREHCEADRNAAADYALTIAQGNEAKANRWINIAEKRAKKLVKLRRAEIEAVAKRLLEVETLTGGELRGLIIGRE